MLKHKYHIIRIIVCLFLINFQIYGLFSQGHNIKLNIKGCSGLKAQFCYYQGDNQYIIQNSIFDKNDKLSFEGKEKLPAGIYLIVIDSIGYFDLLIRNEPEFTISADKHDLHKTVSAKGSNENQLFFNYQKKVLILKTKISEIDSLLAKSNEKKNEELNSQKSGLNQKLLEIVSDLKKEHPESYLTKIVGAMEISNPDSMQFEDPELLRTPFYQNMIRLFIKKNIESNTDFIISETAKLLEKLKGTEANYQFTLGYLLNFYSSFYKNGINQIFVYLADNYFLPDKAKWLKAETLKQIKERRDFLAQGLPGMPSAGLILESTTGEYVSLHQLNSKIIFLYFWSVNCGHCTKSTKTFLDNYKALSDKGVQIYAINIDKDKDTWLKKVEENGLPWINCYDPQETSGYRDKYYVYGSPLLFVIDQDKKIQAVKNGENEIEEFVNQTIKH
jgi:peroxiredoxin